MANCQNLCFDFVFLGTKKSILGKNKLKKFAENETFENMVQFPREDILEKGLPQKGKWRQNFFKNDRPLVLELGCGKGEYTIGLAEMFPKKNFIGIDIKGARMWRGARTASDNLMKNVGFLRTQIELLQSCFEKGEVDEIWITFPDPQIKYRRRRKRLTAPDMLRMYSSILAEDASLHLKTDSQFLHGYTLGVIEGNNYQVLEAMYDIDKQNPGNQLLQIKTNYEQIFRQKGFPITYIKFRLNEGNIKH
jgi:tRNA (guanine-N7-)-methyltransferase